MSLVGVENVVLTLGVVGVGVACDCTCFLVAVVVLGVVGAVVAAFVLRFLNLCLRFWRSLCMLVLWRFGVGWGSTVKVGVGGDAEGCVFVALSKLGGQSAYVSGFMQWACWDCLVAGAVAS